MRELACAETPRHGRGGWPPPRLSPLVLALRAVPRVRALGPGAHARSASASWRRCRRATVSWARRTSAWRARRRRCAPIRRRSSAWRATSSAGCGRARSSSTCRQPPVATAAVKITPGKNAKGRAVRRARVAYYVGRATRASLAFVVCGVVLLLLWRGWFPDLRAAGRRPAPGGRRRAADRRCWRSRSRRACAPRERRRTPRREALSDAELGLRAADDGLRAAGVFGRRRLGRLPAGLRRGQLPGDVPPAGGRPAAGGGGHRLRGRVCFRPAAPPEAGGAVPGPRRVHRRVRAAQRRVPARRGGAPAPRAPAAASRTRSRRCARRRATSG